MILSKHGLKILASSSVLQVLFQDDLKILCNRYAVSSTEIEPLHVVHLVLQIYSSPPKLY